MIAGLTTHTNLYIEKTLQRYKMYLYQLIARPFQEIIASRLDSDLEAFSHNPSDGSLALLAHKPSSIDQMSEPAVPLVLSRITIATICHQ